MEKTEGEERILILCVDRDGDIETKAEIRTPIIGREQNLEAATALALKDPEEADANAMFEAIRIFDRLKSESREHESFEVATISGSEIGGVGADRKIVNELNEVLKKFPATEVILVTDGFTDEMVLPLIESRIPVSSVRRVVIKHSESIEETAALFTRYLRIIWENPKYGRIFLGLPGILLVLLGFLWVFNLLTYFWIAFILVLGFIFLIKGFGVDRLAKKAYIWVKEYSPPPFHVQIASFTAIAGFLSAGIGLYQGFSFAAGKVSEYALNISDLGVFLENLPRLIGWFIQGSVSLIIVGICVVLTGRAIRWYFERDTRLLRTAAIIVVIAWSSQILEQTSRVLINPSELFPAGLVFSIFIGILLAIASFLIIFIVHRKYSGFFRKKEEEIEEFTEG
ncbi:DUF373 family protein [Candidatus Bathyarchaeota archaeon]|nr:DUF373 family protein [Candidatus Bathyarchaeota archaeon]